MDGWLVGWLFVWLFGWLVGWLVLGCSRPVNRMGSSQDGQKKKTNVGLLQYTKEQVNKQREQNETINEVWKNDH